MKPEWTIDGNDDLVAICFKVCTALLSIGAAPVLSGGSAATVYGPEAYRSDDADFIVEFFGKDAEGQAILNALGFTRKGGIWECPLVPVTLDFPDSEVRIGDEIVDRYATLTRGELALRILTPFDCVRDRLLVATSYSRFDPSAFRAAAAVAAHQDVELERVRGWLNEIGEGSRFGAFADRVRDFRSAL